MQTLVLLPQLELTMENVRVVALSSRIGDEVVAEQSLVEVETGKAVQLVPSPKPGFVRKFLVNVNDEIREKAPLCILTDTLDESFDDSPPPNPSDQTVPVPAAAGASKTDAEQGGIKAAPAARKLARDLGVELASIRGSGPGGRITTEDVQKGAPPPLESDWEQLPLSRLALIAQMQRSLAEIPQFHVARQLEVAKLAVRAGPVGFTVRLVRCLAVALERHPLLRTTISGNKTRVMPVSVAIAMETPRGLAAPFLQGGELTSLAAIAGGIASLRSKAQAGTLSREELEGAPFALSNLGMFQVDFFSPLVFQGQTDVLGTGQASNGKAWFNLAMDHRIANGVEAARFLETVQQEILRA